MYIIGEGLGTCHCFSIYLLSFKIKLPKAASKHNCNVSCALSTLFGNTGVMSCKYVFVFQKVLAFPKSVMRHIFPNVTVGLKADHLSFVVSYAGFRVTLMIYLHRI